MNDAQTLAELDHQHLWHPFTQQQRWTEVAPLIIQNAKGCWLIDVDGHRYLDGVGSLWTNVHGHRHPHIDQALRKQLKRMAHSTLLGLSHPPAIQLAKRLIDVAPWGLSRVFYSDSGSTAVEVALKMAYQFHQQTGGINRTKFACLADAYHGDTLGAVSVGAIDLFHSVYRPLLFETVTLPAPRTPGGAEEAECLEQALDLLAQHGADLAALVFEPLVQGAAGMKMHSAQFLERLCREATDRGLLLIADEVATGFARTGTMFAMEQVNVSPDLLCLAKGLSGGYLPLAATLATERIYEAFLGAPDEHKQFFHGHTFTGNPLACAAALASLDVFEDEGVVERTQRQSEHLAYLLKEHIQRLAAVATVRQHGLMVGIDLQRADGTPLDPSKGTGHQVAMVSRKLGVITRPLGDTVVLNPPLAISGEELAQLVSATAGAIERVLGG
jgi:adenosylmethionine---8-amino-7-oxononanoate aminotransferase